MPVTTILCCRSIGNRNNTPSAGSDAIVKRFAPTLGFLIFSNLGLFPLQLWAMRTIKIFAVFAVTGSLMLLASKLGYIGSSGSATVAPRVRVPGIVKASEVIVSAQTAGRIQELAVDEGSWVKKNDLIASLDRDELEAERRQQEAHILQLTARLRQAQELASFQEENTRELITRATAQLYAARSRREQSLAEVEQLRRDLARYEALLESRSLTMQEYERQLSAVQAGEARLRAIEEEISSATADLNLARTNQRKVASALQEVEQTEALVMQARAQLEQVKTRLDYTIVRAPRPGLISLRVAAGGEMVRAGDPIVTIVDLNDIWVTAGVEESLISRSMIGQKLPVALASGEQLQGTVIALSPEGAFATQRDVSRIKRDIRTFEIKVRLPKENRTAHPGMTAYVFLPVSPAAVDGQNSTGEKVLLPNHP